MRNARNLPIREFRDCTYMTSNVAEVRKHDAFAIVPIVTARYPSLQSDPSDRRFKMRQLSEPDVVALADTVQGRPEMCALGQPVTPEL